MPHAPATKSAPTQGPAQGASKKAAAFYDVDGTLIKTNIVHAFAWYARHQPTLSGSLAKSAKTALSIPMFLAADKLSRKWFNKLFYGYYAGEPEDRLVVLAEELFEDVIKPSIFPRTKDLIEEARRAGLRNVIVSGGLDFTVRPLARWLGVDDFIANTLEFENGYATGQLGKPFVAGATKAQIMRDYATRHDIDLGASWAYTDSYSDYPMLAVVGHPTAVNPDFRLRTVARSYDWPVIDLRYHVSHFSCIGYGAENEDAFEELIAEMVDEAAEQKFDVRSRHTLVSDESGARLAMHFEGSTIACITPWFESGTRVRVSTSAPLDDEHCAHCGGADCDFLDGTGELVTRASVQWVWAAPWRAWLGSPQTFTLQLVAFAHKCTAFADEAGFTAGQPGELKLAPNAFLPYGMFDEGRSVTRRASAMFAGTIVSAERPTNRRTGRNFHHLRVDTLPGTLDVVADAVEGDPRPGSLALIEAWLVGTPVDPPSPPAREKTPPGTAKILPFTRG